MDSITIKLEKLKNPVESNVAFRELENGALMVDWGKVSRLNEIDIKISNDVYTINLKGFVGEVEKFMKGKLKENKKRTIKSHPKSTPESMEQAKKAVEAVCKDLIQIRNPRLDRYVKINRREGLIISTKKSPGPYKGIPIIKKYLPNSK